MQFTFFSFIDPLTCEDPTLQFANRNPVVFFTGASEWDSSRATAPSPASCLRQRPSPCTTRATLHAPPAPFKPSAASLKSPRQRPFSPSKISHSSFSVVDDNLLYLRRLGAPSRARSSSGSARRTPTRTPPSASSVPAPDSSLGFPGRRPKGTRALRLRRVRNWGAMGRGCCLLMLWLECPRLMSLMVNFYALHAVWFFFFNNEGM